MKWPGGKRELVNHLLPLFPERFGRYFKPFAGGAAVFFALSPRRAVLADTNGDLINCYIQVRDQPEEVIKRLAEMPNTELDYYAIRAAGPIDPVIQAARLIYLTSLSFNGIHRVNLIGQFNVPYGRKLHIKPLDPVRIR